MEQRQILALIDQGATADEVSRTLEIPLETVKLVCASNEAGAVGDRDITDEDLVLIRKRLKSIAIYGADDGVASRVGMFLLERDKPRVKEEKMTNLTLINQAIIQANQSVKELEEEYASNKSLSPS